MMSLTRHPLSLTPSSRFKPGAERRITQASARRRVKRDVVFREDAAHHGEIRRDLTERDGAVGRPQSWIGCQSSA